MNKRLKESVNGFEKVKTILGSETLLEGNLKFKDSLRICGKFKGTIKTDGYLEIDRDAQVEADVEAKFIKIAGMLKGNVLDSQRLEMYENAKVYGNVKTEILKVDDGVVFEGKCEMKK